MNNLKIILRTPCKKKKKGYSKEEVKDILLKNNVDELAIDNVMKQT